MLIIKILTILVTIISIIFFMVAQMRYFSYLKKTHLPESKYTLLFKFLGIREINFLYVLFIIAHSFFWCFILFYYL